jgi:hypothetical protein
VNEAWRNVTLPEVRSEKAWFSPALARVGAGEDPALVAASWATGEAQWRLVRSKYLMY